MADFIRRTDVSGLTDPARIAARIADAAEGGKAVVFSKSRFDPGELDLWIEVAEQFGRINRSAEDGGTGEVTQDCWIDVSFQPDKQHTFRHSRTAQPLHTDGAYLPDEQTVDRTFFLCQATAPSGGATRFFDSADLLDLVRQDDAGLADDLFDRPLSYGKLDRRGKTAPILSEDPGGLSLNWNYFRVVAEDGSAEARLRERFHLWLETRVVGGPACREINLAPDEGAMFLDRRLLHGRAAFEAALPFDRAIWKCSVFDR